MDEKKPNYADELIDEELDQWCKNIFDNVYTFNQMFCYSYEAADKSQIKFYFVDSQNKTVVLLDNPVLINFVYNYIYSHQFFQRQIDWLLNYEKSGYLYFSNFDKLEKWNKEVNRIYDKYYGKVSDEVLKRKEIIAAKIIENEKSKDERY